MYNVLWKKRFITFNRTIMSIKLKKDSDFFQMKAKSVREIENWIEIEWYASTKDKDRGKDVVEPTAFKSAIAGYMENPIVLLQHNQDKPIGVVKEATIDDKGLYIKASITEDTDGVFSKLKNGVMRAFSIGYRIKDYEIVEEKDSQGFTVDYHQTIKDLELYEISLVSIPMNPYALSKSIDWCFEKEEEVLNNNTIEMEENKVEETVETETVETVEEETVENTESSEAVSEESEVKEASEETVEEVSENSVETTENAEETAESESIETKSIEVNTKSSLEIEVKALQEEIKGFQVMRKELDETKELLKGAIEVIASLEMKLKKVEVSNYSYEQPIQKKSGYANIVSQLKN